MAPRHALSCSHLRRPRFDTCLFVGGCSTLSHARVWSADRNTTSAVTNLHIVRVRFHACVRSHLHTWTHTTHMLDGGSATSCRHQPLWSSAISLSSSLSSSTSFNGCVCVCMCAQNITCQSCVRVLPVAIFPDTNQFRCVFIVDRIYETEYLCIVLFFLIPHNLCPVYGSS